MYVASFSCHTVFFLPSSCSFFLSLIYKLLLILNFSAVMVNTFVHPQVKFVLNVMLQLAHILEASFVCKDILHSLLLS